MHLSGFLVHQICAVGDITHQIWDSFNCGINAATDTFFHSDTFWTPPKNINARVYHLPIRIPEKLGTLLQ